MVETSALARWENFYVIVGSSAGALTGLQFVVMALVADIRATTDPDAIDAFGTPNIVHFGAVLLVSAAVSAPWDNLSSLAWLLAVIGLLGVIYVFIVTRRARRQEGYQPVFEDWVWHAIVPFAAYFLLGISGLLLPSHNAMFLIASVSLLLLFVAIHNAWDTVTYIVLERSKRANG